jgi:hypothetical protein
LLDQNLSRSSEESEHSIRSVIIKSYVVISTAVGGQKVIKITN